MTTAFITGSDGRSVLDKRQKSRLLVRLNWTGWLGVLNIATAVWTKSTGLTLSGDTSTSKTADVFVEGGVVNTVEWITCRITVSDTQIDERTLYFNILPR